MNNKILFAALTVFASSIFSQSAVAGGALTLAEALAKKGAKEGEELFELIFKRATALNVGETAAREAAEHFKVAGPLFKQIEKDPEVIAILAKDISQLTQDDIATIMAKTSAKVGSDVKSAFTACSSCTVSPAWRNASPGGAAILSLSEHTPATLKAIELAPSNLGELDKQILKRGKKVKVAGVNIEIADLGGNGKWAKLTPTDKAQLLYALNSDNLNKTERDLLEAVIKFETRADGKNADLLDNGLFVMVNKLAWSSGEGDVIDDEGMKALTKLLNDFDSLKYPDPKARERALAEHFEKLAKEAEEAGDPSKRRALNRLREKGCFGGLFG